MSTFLVSQSSDAKTAVATLFQASAPVLVEVRFPNCGTSSDWYLCEDEEDLAPILQRLAPGAELHLNSVWDLKNAKGAVTLKK